MRRHFLMTLLAFIIAYRLRSSSGFIPGLNLHFDVGSFPPIDEYIRFSVIAAIFLILFSGFSRMYSLKSTIRDNFFATGLGMPRLPIALRGASFSTYSSRNRSSSA